MSPPRLLMLDDTRLMPRVREMLHVFRLKFQIQTSFLQTQHNVKL